MEMINMATASLSFSQVETYILADPRRCNRWNWGRKRKNRLHICHSPSYLAETELPPQDTPDTLHTWCDCREWGEGVRV